MAPPPDSAAGCDRPVGAGRSTALRAVLAPHQPGPGRQIVIKTGKPSADSRAKPEPKRGRSYSFTNRKVTDCHRSTPLHHFLRSGPVGLSPHTPCRLCFHELMATGFRQRCTYQLFWRLHIMALFMPTSRASTADTGRRWLTGTDRTPVARYRWSCHCCQHGAWSIGGLAGR
jgi:hypothetical protein